MSASLESILIGVWQQSLIDKKKIVDIDSPTYAVRQTSKSKLKQIDFNFEDRELRGLEQNSNTKSRRAKLAKRRQPGYAVFGSRQIYRGRCGRKGSPIQKVLIIPIAYEIGLSRSAQRLS
jgi:hypothetical protein